MPKNFVLKTPPTWRKGQTIFNFLEWLKVKKGMPGNQNERMADPFFLPDEKFEKFFEEFLKQYDK